MYSVVIVYISYFFVRFTLRRSNAESFGIEQTSDLSEVAVALDGVVERRRLHEEGEIALEDSLDALLVVVDEHGRPLALHVAPHLLVRFDARILRSEK